MKFIIILLAIWFVATVGSMSEAGHFLQEHGLRSAMIKLWCGKDGCAP